MRWRTCMLAIVLAIGAVGCQATPQVADVTPPAPSEPPAPAAGPLAEPPKPPDPQPEKAFCTPLPVPRSPEMDSRRQQALVDALRTTLKAATIEEAPKLIAQMGSCLKVDAIDSSSGKMLWVNHRPTFVEQDMFAAWYFDGAWRADHLPVDQFRTLPYPKYYKETPEGAEVISLGRNLGTAHAGSYSLIRFGTNMKVLWLTELYDHLYDHTINDHWLWATYRDHAVYQETHVYWANCCMPTTGQTLWERQGDTFVENAVRTYPSILRTASAFVGAWNEGRWDLAANYAESDQVVAAMKADTPRITLAPEPADLKPLEEAEAAYWDALPPEYRGPEPKVTEYVWPAGPRPLLLRRIGGEWKVVGWR